MKPFLEAEAAEKAEAKDWSTELMLKEVGHLIASESSFTAADGCTGRCKGVCNQDAWVEPLQKLAFCVLVLVDGAVVVGSSQLRVSEASGTPEQYARKDALTKLLLASEPEAKEYKVFGAEELKAEKVAYHFCVKANHAGGVLHMTGIINRDEPIATQDDYNELIQDLAKLPDLNGMGSFTISSLSRL